MKNKIALVTGASSGIGEATAVTEATSGSMGIAGMLHIKRGDSSVRNSKDRRKQ